ncbi:MAG: transglutaminase family protein [Patescibacteria group bacterium]|nr:transglutaminase family protein [Patescibacteria group bacterium]
MKKFIISFCVLLFYLISFHKNTYAASFTTDYDVTYKVVNSNTNVRISVMLTNTSDVYYASSYKIAAGFDDIENVNAYDSDGPITPKISKDEKGQTIDLTFNKRVVGLGNKLNFTLSFDTKEITQKVGRIWEVNIPGIAKQADFSTFNVHVIVPEGFGNPSYMKPQISQTSLVRQGNSYNFTKDQLGSSGISMAFGDEQTYNFVLTYHLYNNHLFPVKTEIALPPSTNYQEVSIDNIYPKPVNVILDKDGNWLALYNLAPSEKSTVLVRGKVIIKLIPKKEVLSQEDLDNYLKEKPYWQISSNKIKKIAQNLTTPRAVYDYVVRQLKYDFSRVSENKPRLGALGVLDNPSSAVCLEFTDLFIALSRAAGIPAREVDGFAYTQNSKERPLSLVKDVLHAWPEYYDREKMSWIMVDPTWGNTTGGIDYFNVLDFDHFAFVIKGENSDYPVPAGGYKTQIDKNSKDVEVSFSDNFESASPVFQITQAIPSNITSGLPAKGSLTIKNSGKVMSSDYQMMIETKFLKPTYQKITIGKIPPLGSVTMPIYFEKTPFLTNKEDLVTITVAGSTFYHKINISPFFFNIWFLLGGGIIVASIIVLSVFITKPRNISFSRQKK